MQMHALNWFPGTQCPVAAKALPLPLREGAGGKVCQHAEPSASGSPSPKPLPRGEGSILLRGSFPSAPFPQWVG